MTEIWKGEGIWAGWRLTTDHAASSYGQPVLVDPDGNTYGPGDIQRALMTQDMIREWIQANLVMQDEARKITGQSVPAFNQSVRENWIMPFVEFGEKRKTRLYLRSELEEYAKNKRIR